MHSFVVCNKFNLIFSWNRERLTDFSLPPTFPYWWRLFLGQHQLPTGRTACSDASHGSSSPANLRVLAKKVFFISDIASTRLRVTRFYFKLARAKFRPELTPLLSLLIHTSSPCQPIPNENRWKNRQNSEHVVFVKSWQSCHFRPLGDPIVISSANENAKF